MRAIDYLREAITPSMRPWLIVAWTLAAMLPYVSSRQHKR